MIGWATMLCLLLLWALMAVVSVHLLRSAGWGWRRPIEPWRGELRGFADVTLQLPLCNEQAVAERVMRAAAALDWPRDRLQIQVLDDSQDETVAIVDRVAQELGAQGVPIEVLRRGERTGYKAGNLQHGLERARGDYIVVLDADSEPSADFLRRVMAPLLADERLGFVQARWSFRNEKAGLLERVQALILDGLMVIEQPRRQALGQPLQFNGTAGVWRRSALEAAGGWLGQGPVSVTEDLDLSFRAELAGYPGCGLPEVAVQTELPSTMAAFRVQQRRWVRGGAEGLRRMARRLLTGDLPARERDAMLGHLARHARQPLILSAALWLPLVQLGEIQLPVAVPGVWPVLLVLLIVAVGAYYGAARRRLGRSAAPAFALAPLVLLLSVGLSLALTASFLSGLLDRRAGEFVRTPKGNDRARFDPLLAFEIGWGLLCIVSAALLALRGEWLAALGVGGVLGGGLCWVGIASLLR